MTPEEKHLWYDFLKYLPITVHRQHIVEEFIVDFYIADKKIVIELDGIQHTSPEKRKADAERDNTLSAWGMTVLRYTNDSVRNNFVWVTESILRHLDLDYSDLKPRAK